MGKQKAKRKHPDERKALGPNSAPLKASQDTVLNALSKDQKAKIATQTQASLQQPFGPDLSTLTVQLLADSACGLLRGGAAHLVADLAVLQEHLQVVPLSDWPALAAKVVGHLCEHFVSGADNTGYALMLYALRAAAHAGPFKGPSATDLAPISNRLGREQSYDARVVYLRLRRALGARDCETALAEELEELARTDQRRAYQTVRFLGLPVEEYARWKAPKSMSLVTKELDLLKTYSPSWRGATPQKFERLTQLFLRSLSQLREPFTVGEEEELFTRPEGGAVMTPQDVDLYEKMLEVEQAQDAALDRAQDYPLPAVPTSPPEPFGLWAQVEYLTGAGSPQLL